VFVPPCANDSGSAIGTAVDAQVALGGPCRLEWDVYSGAEFEFDTQPDPARWSERPADSAALAARLADGAVVAWVRGRAEIGPRALGHRSLLASPLHPRSRERLNAIKRREDYRPVAPCCLLEEQHRWFDSDRNDPYMLFFANVITDALPAVTHRDGTARVQSVGPEGDPALRALLQATAAHTGYGVLCNTSLNYPGLGFINRASELFRYCQQNEIADIVIENTWYRRNGPGPRPALVPSAAQKPLDVPLELNRNDPEIAAIGSEQTGLQLIALALDRLGLEDLSDTDVLDVGCGVRFTQAILNSSIPIGTYTGVDVDADVIEFLNRNVDDPKFRFARWDVRNALYNPSGTTLSPDMSLPIEGRFDVIWLFSVFTHLGPEDAAALLSVLRRYSRPHGRLLFSAELDHEAVRFRDRIPEKPLLRAAYNPAYLRHLVRAGGWTVVADYPPVKSLVRTQFVCRPVPRFS
jgi:hydroxymethyl cephem carbamoyltransferase